MENNKLNKKSEINEIWIHSKFDPNGSYTGNSSDKNYKKPVQDADDL